MALVLPRKRDKKTGLPPAPAGHFWRVQKSDSYYSRTQLVVELRKTVRSVEPVVWWKPETWSRTVEFDSDVLVRSTTTDNEGRPSKWDIYWAACYILDREASEAKKSELLGDYPSKTLNGIV